MKILRKKLLAASLAVALCSATFFCNPITRSSHSSAKAAATTSPTQYNLSKTQTPALPKASEIPCITPAPSEKPETSYMPEKPPTQSPYICNYPLEPKYTNSSAPLGNSPSPGSSSNPARSPYPYSIHTIEEGQWYYIINEKTGGYLQVADNRAEDGQAVITCQQAGYAGSKWCFKSCYSETGHSFDYYIYNGLGDYVLCMAENKTDIGTDFVINSSAKLEKEEMEMHAQPYGTYQPFRFMIGSNYAGNYMVSQSQNSLGEAAVTLGDILDLWNIYEAVSPDISNTPYTSSSPYLPSPSVSPTPFRPSPSITPSPKPTLPSPTPHALICSPIPYASFAPLPPNTTFTYSTLAQWDNGFVGEIVITNNSDVTFKDWAMTFQTLSSISSLWGAEYTGTSNCTASVKCPSWAPTVAPGESVKIGFVASGTNQYLSSLTFSYT